MSREILFAIENARSFQNSGFQRLCPLTLLVGENSSGKTSFFALFYEALGFFNYFEDRAAYFDLGAFQDIVHTRREGKKANGYTITFSVNKEMGELSELLRDQIGNFGLSITYGEAKGRRIATRVACSFGQHSVSFASRAETISIAMIVADREFRGTISFSDPRFIYNRLGTFWGVSDLFGILRGYSDSVDNPPYRVNLTKGTMAEFNEFRPVLTALETAFDSIVHDLGGPVTPTTAMRSAPRRVYTPSTRGDEEEDRTPHRLYRLQQYEPDVWSKVRTGLRNFGKTSGLFDDIEVRSLRGRRKSGPFELIVKRGSISSNIMDVGYGVSQVIPFISDILIENASPQPGRRVSTRTFYVQQPETHLHPSAQAAIGSFFFDLSREPNTRIILETHSDFIVDRIRQHVRTCPENCEDDVVMLFFENAAGVSTAYPVRFDKRGNVLDAPVGYREFFVREELRNLGVGDVSHNRQ